MADILIQGMYFPFPRNGHRVFRIYANGRVESETGIPLGIAIELPLHGDLIDRDAAVKESKKPTIFDLTDVPDFLHEQPIIISANEETQNAN